MSHGQERPPADQQWQLSSSPSSTSSPRGVFSANGSAGSSVTSYPSVGSAEFDSRHESPENVYTHSHYPAPYPHAPYDSRQIMNATQSYNSAHHAYIDSQPHMAGHPHTTSAPPYPQYSHPAPLLQPAPNAYGAQPYTAYPYPYAQPATSPQNPVHHGHYAHQQHLPTMTAAPPATTAGQLAQSHPPHQPDTTGQQAPPGMRPKVTATLWEDEGTLCFQVEVNGICVARRADNHMINGTKLLNVAQMTRGRRDGILKSEKIRNVVKIGPMHLKGVWIPFERALEFANKERITENLYPLFVHNVSNLLQQPPGSTAGMTATQRRDPSSQAQYTSRPPTSGAGGPLTHTNSMPLSGTSHAATSRPNLDRAHTFPTPPASATSVSVMGSVGNSNPAYDWSGGHTSAVPSNQVPVVDSFGAAKSMPTTPATTPPDNSLSQSVHHQYPTSQPYDSRGQVYSAAPQAQTTYAPVPQQQYNYSAKPGEMAPPARPDVKDDEVPKYDYSHGTYPADNRPAYNYNPTVSPDAKGSPRSADRSTPRTVGTAQQWPGYSTPQQQQPQQQQRQPVSSSNLQYVMSDNRTNATPNGYPNPAAATTPQYSYSNGTPSSNKRGRDEDDDPYGHAASGDEASIKRRKTGELGSSVSNGMNRPRAIGVPRR